MNKFKARLKRARKTRAKQAELGVIRLTVYRTPNHIYAQIIKSAPTGSLTLASASTLDKNVKRDGNKTEQAKAVGELVAKRAKEAGVNQVSFDRSGYRYHGRIKALADAARNEGIDF